MALYKLKAMHVEYDILNLSPIRENRNVYPRKTTVVITLVWFF